MPDDQLIGDVAGAAQYLRSLPRSNGKVGGDRVLLGGPSVGPRGVQRRPRRRGGLLWRVRHGRAARGFPLKVTNLVDQLPNLRCPLLGLFGNDDQYPTPEHVDELDRILTELGKPHEFHRYDGAGHAFFNTDRPSYRAEAAADGWERIQAFFKTYLGG